MLSSARAARICAAVIIRDPSTADVRSPTVYACIMLVQQLFLMLPPLKLMDSARLLANVGE